MTPSFKPTVLMLGEIAFAFESWAKITSIAHIVTPKSLNRSDFINECRSGAFDGVSTIYRTIPSVSITGLFDELLIAALPSSLRFICHNGAGYDQISVATCSQKTPPIRISNVPIAVDGATADIALFLIIGALRNLNSSIFSLRSGKFRGAPVPALGHDPHGKLLGILGMGNIGRNLKPKVEALGMTVQYHNRSPLSEELSAGAKYVPLDELLSTSDVISVHLPLNPHTRHFISQHQFAQMKSGVVIINTARGAVIDENALVDALDKEIVSSAGLDVFENEPDIHPGLVANQRVFLLPHMGTWSVETLHAMEERTIANVYSAIKTSRLQDIVSEQADIQ